MGHSNHSTGKTTSDSHPSTCIQPSTSFSLSRRYEVLRARRDTTCRTSNIKVTTALHTWQGSALTHAWFLRPRAAGCAWPPCVLQRRIVPMHARSKEVCQCLGRPDACAILSFAGGGPPLEGTVLVDGAPFYRDQAVVPTSTKRLRRNHIS